MSSRRAAATVRCGLIVAIIGAAWAAPSPKALLINLPKHTDRYNAVKQQLESAGVEYERAEAVDGKQLSSAELKANVTWIARKLLTRGMIGCFLSHRSCWQRCVDAGNGPILGTHKRRRIKRRPWLTRTRRVGGSSCSRVSRAPLRARSL